MSKRECDVCWGLGVIKNNMGNQQPCWQCHGSGKIEDNSYNDDDDD